MSDAGANARPASQPPGGIAPSWFDHPGQASQQNVAPTTPDVTHATTQAGTTPSSGADLPGNLIGRTSIALIAVIGVILVCAWALKRLGFQRDRASQSLPIVASRSLGQRERVVVIEVEDEWLVLGVTPQNITALHRRPAPADRDSPDTPHAAPTGARPTFGQALAENLTRLTGRGRS
ncbi:flagellar biosynthetic protein FliO [Salinisphaera hydrothermalis]|uniref:flagellar biosynthetic protein FliO n=1 Tax=Salinisphaera hydrothermalis TaxID=563188 RepID=UPI00333E395A